MVPVRGTHTARYYFLARRPSSLQMCQLVPALAYPKREIQTCLSTVIHSRKKETLQIHRIAPRPNVCVVFAQTSSSRFQSQEAGGALGEAAAVSTRAEQRRAGQRAGSAQSHLISSFSEDHAAAAPKAML